MPHVPARLPSQVPIIKACVAVDTLARLQQPPGAPPPPATGLMLAVDISIGALNGPSAVPLMRAYVAELPQLRPLCLLLKAMLREAGG